MLCVAVDGAGAMSVVTPTPSDISTCSYVLLTPVEAEGVSAPFDYSYASAIFAFFFIGTVGLWWVSRNFASIVDAVRRW